MIPWITRISPQVHMLWRGRWRAGIIEPARVLYDHELVLVTEGSCVVRVGEREHALEAGHFLIVPPGVSHVTMTGARGVRRCCVHFDWLPTMRKTLHPWYCFYPRKPAASRIVRAPDFVPEPAFRGSWETGEAAVPGLLETLFHRWHTGEALAQAACRGVFLELLTRLTWPRQGGGGRERAQCRRRAEEERARQRAWAVRDLLNCDEMPPFGEGEGGEGGEGGRGGGGAGGGKPLCREGRRAVMKSEGSIQARLRSLGYSYPYLCRVFRRTFGMTPVEYRTARRLEYAKMLLRTRKFPVAEVARAAGFQDPGYFARKFRHQNGVAPSGYC